MVKATVAAVWGVVEMRLKHGHRRTVNGKTSPSYISWCHMRPRCLNPQTSRSAKPSGGEITRNGDCRQRQHTHWPGVVQHLEFLRASSIWVRQIGNRERRYGCSRSDHEVRAVEDERHGVANLVELAPAPHVRRYCDVRPGADSLDRGRLVKPTSIPS